MLNTRKTSLYASIRPWLIWLCATTFYFYKSALEVSPSVMANDWMQAFALNATAFGYLGGCYFYSYLLMQIPIGILLDCFSTKKITMMAILLCAIGTLIVGKAPTFDLMAIGRLMTGFGAAVAGLGACKLITIWFPQKRFALMLGLMLTFGMLGSIAAEGPLAMLVNHIGWRLTLIYASYFGLGLLAIFGLIVRDCHQSNPNDIVSQFPRKTFSIHSLWRDIVAILKNKENWWLSLYSSLSFAPILTFGSLWGVPYLQAIHGFEKTTAAAAVSTIFIGFAFGAPLTGWLANFLKQRLSIIIVGTSLAFISMMMILYYPHPSIALLHILLFVAGFMLSVSLLSFSLIKEVNHLALAGTVMGFMNTFVAAIGALTNPLLGRLLDLHWHGQMLNGMRIFPPHAYHIAMSILPLSLLLSLLCLIFTHETHGEQMAPDEG